MKGTVGDRVTKATVPRVLVSLWTVADRDTPLVVTSTDDNGAFEITTTTRLDRDGEGWVLRVHREADGGVLSAPAFDAGDVASDARAVEFGPQLAVVHVPSLVERAVAASRTIWVDDAFGERDRWFGRALTKDGAPVARATMSIADVASAAGKSGGFQAVPTDTGGFFGLSLPATRDWSQWPARAWTVFGDLALAADWNPEPGHPDTDLVLTEPGDFRITGELVAPAGTQVDGLFVQLLDRAGAWRNPVAGGTTANAGRFVLDVPRWLPVPPAPTLLVLSDGAQVASHDVTQPWKDGQLLDVQVPLAVATTRTLNGTVLHRLTRQPVAQMRVESWVTEVGQASAALRQVVTSGIDGTFSVTVPAPGVGQAPPSVLLRLFAGSTAAGETAVDPMVLRADPAVVFLETEVVPPPDVVRIHGRLMDSTSRKPLSALRVEVWDRSPRVGGMVGVSAFAAADGTFELAVPASGAPVATIARRVLPRLGGSGASDRVIAPPAAVPGSPATPSLFFRVYAGDELIGTTDGELSWASDGSATAVVAVSPAVRTTDDVVLHELGETLAGTVNRMQNELNRYPSTMGAFLVDELDLTVPVAVRLDALGQVRTRVLEQAPAEGGVGQVRMRVRPVVGGDGGAAQPLDQPLRVLSMLTPSAIATLNARRVYSVEDLARLASSSAGREALADLRLGVDLDALIELAALLATPLLPRRVREELVGLGVGGLRAFVAADAAALAAGLAPALEGETSQPVSEADVEAWQKAVRDVLLVPLPTAET